ncbi:MAG: GerMN domain-containing protein [Pyrinomonadaceae bacterium]
MNKLLLLAFVFIFSVSGFGQDMTVKVFFLSEIDNPDFLDCTSVRPTDRKIPKTRAVAKAALLELFKGPTPEEEEKGFSSLSPDETKDILKSVKIKNGAAYVNFNEIVYTQMGTATTSCGSGFFSSIEATLKQFPTIKRVFYAIEGNPRDFYEWVQVGECPEGLKNCSGKNF